MMYKCLTNGLCNIKAAVPPLNSKKICTNICSFSKVCYLSLLFKTKVISLDTELSRRRIFVDAIFGCAMV
jgi:hypothetical protein